jgi:hypothetical protein
VAIVNAYLVVEHRDHGYRGLDRDAWGALRDAHHDGRLPPALTTVMAELAAPSAGLLMWSFTRDRARAHELRQASASLDGAEWDVVGVHSALLRAEAAAEWHDDALISVGFDLVGAGEWSLLAALTDSADDLTPDLSAEVQRLNDYGLLPSSHLREALVETYANAEDAGLVEERAWDLPIDLVEVFVPR